MTFTHVFLLLATFLCIIISLCSIAFGILNKRLAGELKMNVGWLHKNGIYFTLFLGLTIFLSNMLVRAFGPELISPVEISIALCCIFLGMVYFFRSGLSNLEIRENGIVDFWMYLRWEDIESYEWNGSTITIQFRRGVLMWSSWYIPIAYKENLEYMLHQNVFPKFQSLQEDFGL